MNSKNYVKLKNQKNIYVNKKTGDLRVMIRVKGKRISRVFFNKNPHRGRGTTVLAEAKEYRSSILLRGLNENSAEDSGHNENLMKQKTVLTFEDLLCGYKEVHFSSLRETSQKTINSRLNSLLDTAFLNLKVDEINSDDIDALIKRAKRRTSRKRFNFDLNLKSLKIVFNYCQERYDSKFINPVRRYHFRMGVCRKKEVKPKALNKREFVLFLSHLSYPYRELALIQYVFALRIGEVTALKWDEVNFDQRKVRVSKSLIWLKRNRATGRGPTKEGGVKNHFIESRTYEILRSVYNKSDYTQSDDYVFHEDGLALSYKSIQKNYNKAFKLAGLRDKISSCTHVIRHTAITHHRHKTNNANSAQALSKHKDLSMVDKVYSNIGVDSQIKAAKIQDEMMSEILGDF